MKVMGGARGRDAPGVWRRDGELPHLLPWAVRFGLGCRATIRLVIPTKLKRLPVGAVTPGLDLEDGDKRLRRERRVLLLANIPGTQLKRLKDRGAAVTRVEDVFAAVELLARESFDAAIVDMKAPGGGTALIKSIKAGVGSVNDHPPDSIAGLVSREMEALSGKPEPRFSQNKVAVAIEEEARRRCRVTPFYLVLEDEQQFAIMVIPPDHSYLEDGKGISLPDAVMSLDVGKLLLRGPPLG
jgi:hypothetical protein